MSFIQVTVGNNAVLELCPKKVEKKADLILDDRRSIELDFDFCFWLTVSLCWLTLDFASDTYYMMQQVQWKVDMKNVVVETECVCSCTQDSKHQVLDQL